MEMHFWDSNVWAFFNLFAILLITMLIANILKRKIMPLRKSLIPTSVLGGILLLVFSGLYRTVTGTHMYDTAFFDYNGSSQLEMLTYHALALGFIASALKTTNAKLTKKRTGEIFNTGITTVSTYVIQAIFGLGITIIASKIISGFYKASGVLLAFGFGQGTGQAMNYGGIYQEAGFEGGKSFGLTIAAIGFLVASFGGVIYLNVLKKKGRLKVTDKVNDLFMGNVQDENESPMQEGIDKLTLQIGMIALAYIITYTIMSLLGKLLPGMRALIFGFNFLIGVISATLVKLVINFLEKKKIMTHEYRNNFLLTRISNFFFDIMVVAGIAAIRLDVLEKYWGIIAIICLTGFVITYAYNHFVARKLFPEYADEQFLAMFGMLSGTASTGIILLREADNDFKTPAADNLVYQNFTAIVFGLPIMFLATFAMTQAEATFFILIAFFIVLNIILFRKQIFKKRTKK